VSEPTQLDALKDLVQSQGWQEFTALVMADIEGKFRDDITNALGIPDKDLALDKMRQVAAVRLAGLRWLRLPQERITGLVDGLERAEAEHTRIGRRPVGV
jgi:hypothetical protein